MNWQTELNSSLSWILTALFWVVLCFSVVMIALKQTSFGQKFWHIASPSINRRNSIKIILMLLVLFTMILLEVRFSVLNSFFYNGLYSSMQELDADKFWFFAKLNAPQYWYKLSTPSPIISCNKYLKSVGWKA